MMVFSPIDEELYDVTATQITYCKLFPLIMQDFLTRLDCIEMMKSTNLPVNTQVNTVVTAVLTPPTAVAGAGTGSGSGQVIPVYLGNTPLGGSQALANQKKAIKDAGGQTTDTVLNNALGQ